MHPRSSTIHLVLIGILLGTILLSTRSVAQLDADGKRSKLKMIPTAESAVKIAEVILADIYGRESIAEQKPLLATAENGVWHVQGTFHDKTGMVVGGTAHIYLSVKDARVVRFRHTK